MSTTVHNQTELDQAVAAKASPIYIEANPGVWLTVRNTESSHVVAWGSSHVVARGSSHVVARGSSHVEAWGSSHVEAWESSHVEARESSHVEAWGSSHVEAWESSHVVARESSHVEARESSHVVARESSHVVAWGSSHVVARGSSHVVASKLVAVHLHSQRVTLDGDSHVIDMTEIDLDDTATWLEYHGVEVKDGVAYLYKAVNLNWTTDRGVDYSPGATPEAADWKASRECGHGLHFCAHPMQSLGYLGETVDKARFLKVGVRVDELVTLSDKAKARRVVVACVEVDRYGNAAK